MVVLFFFFNDTATTEIYTLSLHDALPISSQPASSGETTSPARRSRRSERVGEERSVAGFMTRNLRTRSRPVVGLRSEEHTSELQSRQYLVCRLLLEKKKNTIDNLIIIQIV